MVREPLADNLAFHRHEFKARPDAARRWAGRPGLATTVPRARPRSGSRGPDRPGGNVGHPLVIGPT